MIRPPADFVCHPSAGFVSDVVGAKGTRNEGVGSGSCLAASRTLSLRRRGALDGPDFLLDKRTKQIAPRRTRRIPTSWMSATMPDWPSSSPEPDYRLLQPSAPNTPVSTTAARCSSLRQSIMIVSMDSPQMAVEERSRPGTRKPQKNQQKKDRKHRDLRTQAEDAGRMGCERDADQ